MKPEKKSWTRALFAYAGGEKKKLVLSVVLSVLSVTLGLAPFYCMYGLLCQFAAGTATSAPVCQTSARKNPIARSLRGQRKARDPADLGLWKRYSDRSALAELRRATGGFEAGLHETEARFCLILRGFSSFLLFVHQFLNPRFCRLLSDFNPNLFLMCRLLC